MASFHAVRAPEANGLRIFSWARRLVAVFAALLLVSLVVGLLRPNRAEIAPAYGIESWPAVADGEHNSNTDLIHWRGAFWLIHAARPLALREPLHPTASPALGRRARLDGGDRVPERGRGHPRPQVRRDRRPPLSLLAEQPPVSRARAVPHPGHVERGRPELVAGIRRRPRRLAVLAPRRVPTAAAPGTAPPTGTSTGGPRSSGRATASPGRSSGSSSTARRWTRRTSSPSRRADDPDQPGGGKKELAHGQGLVRRQPGQYLDRGRPAPLRELDVRAELRHAPRRPPLFVYGGGVFAVGRYEPPATRDSSSGRAAS